MSDDIAPTAEQRIIAAVDGLGRSLRAELSKLQVDLATEKAGRSADHDRLIEHDTQIRELEQRAALAETVRELERRVAETATQTATNTADIAAMKAAEPPRTGAGTWIAVVVSVAAVVVSILLRTVDIH